MATPNSTALKSAGPVRNGKPPLQRPSKLGEIVLNWENDAPCTPKSTSKHSSSSSRKRDDKAARKRLSSLRTKPVTSCPVNSAHTSSPGCPRKNASTHDVHKKKNFQNPPNSRKKKTKKSKMKIISKVIKKKAAGNGKRRHGKLYHKSRGGYPPRSKSTNSRPSKPQTRTLRSDMSSTGVYKTHSDTALSSGVRNITIRDNHHSGIQTRRRYRSAGSSNCQNLEEIADHILKKQAKNIVVMAGAGISTPSGIPDFRTPGTGLYDNLRQYRIPYPQAIFDIDYFERNPKPFYTLAKELYPSGKYRPNYVHYFLRMLYEKGLLLRLYTQNIDGLERMAGIPASKVIEAHGTFLTASCTRCKLVNAGEEVKAAIFQSETPKCKREGCRGLVKPDIVFFGEDLPRRFYYYLRDFPQADMLIVMGTSLEVEPFAGIVDSVRIYVPRVLFNREAVGPFERKRRMNDVVIEGDLLERVKVFARLLGWKKDLEKLIAEESKKLETIFKLDLEVVHPNNESNNNQDSPSEQPSEQQSEASLPGTADWAETESTLEITSVQDDTESTTSQETSSSSGSSGSSSTSGSSSGAESSGYTSSKPKAGPSRGPITKLISQKNNVFNNKMISKKNQVVPKRQNPQTRSTLTVQNSLTLSNAVSKRNANAPNSAPSSISTKRFDDPKGHKSESDLAKLASAKTKDMGESTEVVQESIENKKMNCSKSDESKPISAATASSSCPHLNGTSNQEITADMRNKTDETNQKTGNNSITQLVQKTNGVRVKLIASKDQNVEIKVRSNHPADITAESLKKETEPNTLAKCQTPDKGTFTVCASKPKPAEKIVPSPTCTLNNSDQKHSSTQNGFSDRASKSAMISDQVISAGVQRHQSCPPRQRGNIVKSVTERLYNTQGSKGNLSLMARMNQISRHPKHHQGAPERPVLTHLRRPTQQMQNLSTKVKREAELLFGLASRANALSVREKEKENNALPKLTYRHGGTVAGNVNVNNNKTRAKQLKSSHKAHSSEDSTSS